jgi:hypothetical protein
MFTAALVVEANHLQQGAARSDRVDAEQGHVGLTDAPTVPAPRALCVVLKHIMATIGATRRWIRVDTFSSSIPI